jgi:hypothetical protein
MSDYAQLREALGHAYELLSQYVPPENEEVPAVTGTGAVGSVLSCTMGTWKYMGQSSTYAYAWSNGAPVGTDAPTYTVDAADTGLSVTCTVTATNTAGSTAAPPSNAVVIAGVARQAEEAPHHHRAKADEEPHHARARK